MPSSRLSACAEMWGSSVTPTTSKRYRRHSPRAPPRPWPNSLKRIRGTAASEKPTSTGRGRIGETVSGTGAGKKTTEGRLPPTDAKAFAEWVQ